MISYIREILGDLTNDLNVGNNFNELDDLVERQDKIINEMDLDNRPSIAAWCEYGDYIVINDFVDSETKLLEAIVADKVGGELHDVVHAIVDILGRYYG